jgi:hypothetical protein
MPTLADTDTLRLYLQDYTADAVAITGAQLELGSTATSYEPYSNICPISGRTEVVTQRAGVNVWDEEWEVGALNTDTGAVVYSANRIRAKNFIPCLPNTTYSFYYPPRASASTGNIRVFYYDENEAFISYKNWTVDGTFTTPSGTRYMKFYTNGSYGETYQNDISINYPSTDTDYHAYQGETYTTELGRTVYGGTLDVVSGELVVTHAIRTFDGTEDWKSPDSSGICWLRDDTLKKTSNYEGTIIASTMPTAMTRQRLRNDFECGISGYEASGADNYWYIKAPSQTTQTNTALKAWLQANNAQVCYELATPQTYQLTPQQIDLLLGTNHLWSDGR